MTCYGPVCREQTYLSNPHYEKAIRLFAVVTRELPQHLRKFRVVRSGTDETHRKDRVHGDFEIVVVRVSREGVEDGEGGVRGTDETESEGNRPTDDGFTVVHLVRVRE